jgi:hypothetical protein
MEPYWFRARPGFLGARLPVTGHAPLSLSGRRPDGMHWYPGLTRSVGRDGVDNSRDHPSSPAVRAVGLRRARDRFRCIPRPGQGAAREFACIRTVENANRVDNTLMYRGSGFAQECLDVNRAGRVGRH